MAPSAQEVLDAEHLRLLRIGYFISAGYTALFIPFGLVYAAMGLVFSRLAPPGAPGPPAAFTWILGLAGLAFAAFATAGAALKLLTAVRLKERRSRIMCLVTAGLSCLEMPYGTALGVMTFIVLGRPSVRQSFRD